MAWYWHSKAIGGYGAVDYLMKIENLLFRNAVETLTGISIPISIPAVAQNIKHTSKDQSKSLILPERAGFPHTRIRTYLCHERGIDNEIAQALIQEGKLYEDNRGNVVFVGFDECNNPRFASLRGTYGSRPFRMDCTGSNKRYSFNMIYTESKTLYIFESPIDAMSHASLVNTFSGNTGEWKNQNRLSLSGTSDTALYHYLKNHHITKKIVLCLDNDEAGRNAADSISGKYVQMGYMIRTEFPHRKDFNEDLLAFRQGKKYGYLKRTSIAYD